MKKKNRETGDVCRLTETNARLQLSSFRHREAQTHFLAMYINDRARLLVRIHLEVNIAAATFPCKTSYI